VEEGNHLEPRGRPIRLLRDHVMVQQVPFYLSTLEMLRISIDYVALFLYIENINVVVVVWSMATLVTITHKFRWAQDARAPSANDYCTDCTVSKAESE
jgi:hypothetical protein